VFRVDSRRMLKSVLLLMLLTLLASALLAYPTSQFFESDPIAGCLVDIEHLRGVGTIWVLAIFLLACAGPPIHYWYHRYYDTNTSDSSMCIY